MSENKDEVKEWYESGEMTFEGRSYKFLKMNYKKRRHIFGYLTSIMPMVEKNDFSFMEEGGKFDDIEQRVFSNMSLDGTALDKIPNHFDDYLGDYTQFILFAMAVISYPLKPAARTS